MRYPPEQQHPYIVSATHPPVDPNPDIIVFAQEEMDMIAKKKMKFGPGERSGILTRLRS
jgi:hypothetical protein